jgi:hypothetical protein
MMTPGELLVRLGRRFELLLIGLDGGPQMVERVPDGPHLVKLDLPLVADELPLVQRFRFLSKLPPGWLLKLDSDVADHSLQQSLSSMQPK